MMKKLKLVMVGNGMAGVRTLEELLKIAPDLYDITVFGAEPHPNYNRILLSPVLAGEQTIDEIILNDWQWYADNHITLHTGFTVTDVDRSREFYRRFVGLEELEPVDDARFGGRKYSYRHGATTITLRSFGKELPADTGTGGIQYVVSDVEVVDL